MLKRLFLFLVVKPWRCYVMWCDEMGLTPDNKRCCVPQLSDPERESLSLKTTQVKSN